MAEYQHGLSRLLCAKTQGQTTAVQLSFSGEANQMRMAIY